MKTDDDLPECRLPAGLLSAAGVKTDADCDALRTDKSGECPMSTDEADDAIEFMCALARRKALHLVPTERG